MTVEDINALIAVGNKQGTLDTNKVSDTFHTFEELYAHRIELFITLCRLSQYYAARTGLMHYRPWRSKAHSDGSQLAGWFVLGLEKEYGKQITYHLPISYWDQTNFVDGYDKAPDWDGHTSDDVLDRLRTF